jgi:hypothetical protein
MELVYFDSFFLKDLHDDELKFVMNVNSITTITTYTLDVVGKGN